MMGMGFLAASGSEYFGKWSPVVILVAMIVGGFIGLQSDRQSNRESESAT